MKFRIITICIILLVIPIYIYAQTTSGSGTRPSLTVIKRAGSFPFRKKPTKEQKKQLQPNSQDLQQYEQFLDQPKTGIVKLLPDLGCYENPNIVKADETCLNAIPESSFYSFREREHTIEILSDIRLKDGYLISDGVFSQGILVKLGDVKLENLTVESQGLSFVRGFVPEFAVNKVRNQYFQILKGINDRDYEYKKILPAYENTTYVLRVVAYKGRILRRFRGFVYDLLEGDKRIDVIIAFRIVRKEQNGDLTLIWKELERKDAPRIKFQKKTNK